MWRRCLEGSLRRVVTKLRITAQLIKVADGLLAELGDEVVMGWRWLGHIWDRDDPAARFPS